MAIHSYKKDGEAISKKQSKYSFLIPRKKLEIFCLLILLIEIVVLFIFNFTRSPNLVNHDSSTMFNQLREIVSQGTLFPENWRYASTMNLESTLPLAAIFYKLGLNQFTSFAIANNIQILLYIFTIIEIFRLRKLGTFSTYFTLFLIFIPYTAGMLGYMPMLFTGVASYGIKVYLILLMIKLWLSFEANSSFVSQIPWILLGVTIGVISGISSSIYLLTTALAPFYAYIFFKFLMQKNLKGFLQKNCIALYIITAALFAGIVYNRLFLQVKSNADSIKLVTPTNFIPNLSGWFTAPLNLFGGLNGEIVTSVDGLKALFNTFLILLLFISLGYAIYKNVKQKKNDSLLWIIICVYVVNSIILIITYTTYGAIGFEERYLLLPMFPLFFSLACMLEDIYNDKTELFLYLKNCFLFVLILGAVGSSILSYKNYFKEDNDADRYFELVEAVDKYDPELVFIYSDDWLRGSLNTATAFFTDHPTVRIVPVYDLSSEYYDAEKNALINPTETPILSFRDRNEFNSKAYVDSATHPDRSILVVPKEKDYLFDQLPEYLRKYYTYQETAADYDIYLSTTGDAFDFDTAIRGDISIEYPYTKGYTLLDSIDPTTGALVSNPEGGLMLYGPYSYIEKGTYNVVVNYTLDDSIDMDAVAEVIINGTHFSTPLEPGKTQAIIENVTVEDENSTFEVNVFANANQQLELYSFEYLKQ